MPRKRYPSPYDVRGIRIKVGDIIVWPVRRGSKMILCEGTVCEAAGKGCVVKKGIVVLNKQGRRCIIETPSRCAVVADYITESKGKEE